METLNNLRLLSLYLIILDLIQDCFFFNKTLRDNYYVHIKKQCLELILKS